MSEDLMNESAEITSSVVPSVGPVKKTKQQNFRFLPKFLKFLIFIFFLIGIYPLFERKYKSISKNTRLMINLQTKIKIDFKAHFTK